MTANIAKVVLPQNASQTVAYLIQSNNDSEGFFYTDAGTAGNETCSMGIPFAVGYTFTMQNKSGAYFNPEGAEWNCVIFSPPGVYSTVLGFVGVQQTYVNCGGYICDQASDHGAFARRT